MAIGNETENQLTLDALLEEEDQNHDGWGPVRLRRSSMPAPLLAPANDVELNTDSETRKPLNS